MSGPAPKPRALRILEGNPANRPLNDREPQPRTGVPDCPEWLDAEGQAEWRRVTAELAAINMLTHVDRAALSAYCYAWSQLVAMAKECEAEGVTMTNKMGRNIAPEARLALSWADKVKSFGAEFGLTPASRTKLATPEAKPADPFADLED